MIKILIVDDQLIVCEGLQKILDSVKDFQVTGIANDGQEALLLLEKEQPDLVLMDLKMPVMNGIIATRKIKEKYAGLYVLVLTTYDDDEWVFDAVRAGASGYLLKDTPPAELIVAIRGTVSGKSFVDPNVTGRLLEDIAIRKSNEKQPTSFNLSEREKQILSFLAQGLTNADISRQLYLTEGTIRNYTSEIFQKLGVSDRTQAAVVAIRYGLVELD